VRFDTEPDVGGLVLLVVTVEGLVSSNPWIIAVGPYKSDDASGPSSAMVVWCE
jgi:hypothetical protein